MQCFDAHIPGARHRDAGAIEQKAPTTATTTQQNPTPQRRIITPTSPAASTAQAKVPHDTLIIASRLKEYIAARSGGYNTSAAVIDVLSDYVRTACDRAIESARADGRKTIMERDLSIIKKFN